MENQCTCLTPAGRCQNEADKQCLSLFDKNIDKKIRTSGPLCTKHIEKVIEMGYQKNIQCLTTILK